MANAAPGRGSGLPELLSRTSLSRIGLSTINDVFHPFTRSLTVFRDWNLSLFPRPPPVASGSKKIKKAGLPFG